MQQVLCKMISFSTINATGCKVDNKWCISHLVYIKIKIYKFKSYLYARGKKIKSCACQTCLRNVRRSHVHYLQSKIEIAGFFMYSYTGDNGRERLSISPS
jgi:hypothetical protein